MLPTIIILLSLLIIFKSVKNCDWTDLKIDQSKQDVLGHLSMQPEKIILTSVAPIMMGGDYRSGIRQQNYMIFVSLPRASYATCDPYKLHLVHVICPDPSGHIFFAYPLPSPHLRPRWGRWDKQLIGTRCIT